MANDTGSNYFFIPGGETPAPVTPPVPTEPVSPFEKYLIALENLQPAVEFFPSSTQQPSTPAFTPMAAPAAVRVSPSKPDLSNPLTIDQQSFITPTQPPSQEVETGGGGEPTESVEVGDGLITDENKNKYLTEFKMDLQGPNVRPTVTSPPEVIAPPETEAPPSIFTPSPVVSTPVTPPPTVIVPEVKIPELVEPPKTTFPIVTPPEKPVVPKPVVPTIPAIVPVTPTNRQPIVRPVVEPTTIPIATRKMIESLSPGYFKDINYDPDEILAAAMRSMGGRQARRSILNELQ